MTIDLEKILSISAKEWFEITGKKPTEYKVLGVHAIFQFNSIDDLKLESPSAEVIVGYKTRIITTPNAGCSKIYVYGTALIPKIQIND